MSACPRCQHPHEAEAVYCSRCGVKLAAAQDRWEDSANPSGAAAAVPRPRAELESPAAPAASGSALPLVLLLVGGVLLLMLLACGGAMALYLGRSNSAAPPPVAAIPTVNPAVAGGVLPPTLTPPPAPAAPTPASPAEVAPQPDPPPDRRVALNLSVQTWREGRPGFDLRAELARRLKQHGIEVLAQDAPDVQGQIVVAWVESRGRRYGVDGLADETAPDNDLNRGTDLDFSLEFWPPGADPEEGAPFTLHQEEALGFTTWLPAGDTLYDVVIASFQQEDKPFAHVGELLAAVLKRKDADAGLTAALVEPELGAVALQALKVGGFQPATAADRVRWAIAAEDWDKVPAEGHAAVPILIPFYTRARGSMLEDELAQSALVAMTAIGGQKVQDFLVQELHGCMRDKPAPPPPKPVDREGDPEAEADVEPDDPADYVPFDRIAEALQLIEAVGQVKAREAAPDLTLLAADKEAELNRAARAALKALDLPVPPGAPVAPPAPQPVPAPAPAPLAVPAPAGP